MCVRTRARVCVCVCEREREKFRERGTDRGTYSQRQREGKEQSERSKERGVCVSKSDNGERGEREKKRRYRRWSGKGTAGLGNCRAQWLRGRTSDSRLGEPGFEYCAAVLKPWASFFTLLCSS